MRWKLLDPYYAGAVDIALLRSEQERTSSDARETEERLAGIEATLSEWQEVLGITLKFASNRAPAYRSANDRIRRLSSSAFFDELVVGGGEIADVHYRPPFELVFGVTEFAQGGMERETGVAAPGTTEGVEFVYRLARGE